MAKFYRPLFSTIALLMIFFMAGTCLAESSPGEDQNDCIDCNKGRAPAIILEAKATNAIDMAELVETIGDEIEKKETPVQTATDSK